MQAQIIRKTMLDPVQAAAHLRIKAGTLATWRSTGRYGIPYSKVGKSVRYSMEDLDAFLASNTRTATE